MLRINKWKLEKVKVKAVFRLQFHATHIPQTGWDKLFISFIPTDSGKASAKTSKSVVRNGNCKWADPIYETTRLLQDIKTKQYDEKLFKLVIAMGSSRSSLLGEAHINLADYADATKPSTVALPLYGCNHGTVLHVTVQLLTSKTGFREFEQQRELRERGLHVATNNHAEPMEKTSAAFDMKYDQIDKANARVRFKSEARELPSLDEEEELIEDYADSAVGVDDSSNTSESLYAEKHDSSTHEIDSLKSIMTGDLGGQSLSLSPTEKGDSSAYRNNDWVHSWSSDYSMDNELAAAAEENSRLRASLELAESSILELKLEMTTLRSHTDDLGAETQKFAQLLSAEIASGEEMAKEVFLLKSECSNFKKDFEQLRHSRINPFSDIARDQLNLSRDLQNKWVQGLLILEEKVREIQKKACLRYHDRDVSFLHPDLEAVQHLLKDLKQCTTQKMSFLNVQVEEQVLVNETKTMILHEPEPSVTAIVLQGKISELQVELEEATTIRDNLVRKMDQMECYYEALIQELEENQKHMLGELQNLRNEHSTCLYAISSCKSQMENVNEGMNEQLLKFSEERYELESLNKELERRAVTSEAALERSRWNYSIAVDQLQKDLQLLSFQVLSMFETSENLVRKAFVDASESCLQENLEDNSEAVNSCLAKGYTSFLQKQCRTRPQETAMLFSEALITKQEFDSDMVLPFTNCTRQREVDEIHVSIDVEDGRCFDTSESVASQNVDVACRNSDHNVHSIDADRVQHSNDRSLNSENEGQHLGGGFFLDDQRGSVHLQEELYQQFEDELYEMLALNIHLDVFSRALYETLHEASCEIKHMKEEMDQLAEHLAHSIESEECLMLRLQVALKDVNAEKDSKAHSISKCNELVLQNQVLKEKFQNLLDENSFLSRKVTENESIAIEYKNIESKYEGCTAEKTELLNLLEQEALENCGLQSAVSTLNDELAALRTALGEQSVVKNNLESTVLTLLDKFKGMWSRVITLSELINVPSICSMPMHDEMEERNLVSTVMHMEELLQKTYEKILQVTQKIKDMEEQRDIAQQSLSIREAEISFIKKKHETEIQEMLAGFKVSNIRVEKLQLELEDISRKIMISSDAEARYADHSEEISSKLAVLEVELQNASLENKDLAQKILDLQSINEELEKTKLTTSRSMQENQALMMSIHAGDEESVNLKKELCDVQETLGSTKDELDSERSLRLQLETMVTDLSKQLNLKNDLLLSFEKEKNELLSLKQLVLDYELEKEKICNLLSLKEEERESTQQTLNGKEAEIWSIKRKHESEIQEMMIRINLSNDGVEKLQMELENISNKVTSCDAKKRHAEHSMEISLKLAVLEVQLQNASLENKNLAQKILDLERINEELARTKLTISKSMQENQALMMSVHAGNEESVGLKKEICDVKETLVSIKDELDSERSLRSQLEAMVTDLSKQLNVKSDQLLSFEEEKTELVCLKQPMKNQELEKETLCNLLFQREECLRKANESNSCLYAEVTDLQTHSKILEECFMAADLELICTRNQLQNRMKELFQQLESLDRCYCELHLKHLNVLTRLNGRISSEAQYVEENAKLLTIINSLRSDLESVVMAKNDLADRNNYFVAEHEKYKAREEIADLQHLHETEQLKHMLLSCEEALDNLRYSRDEQEITIVVLREKYFEQHHQLLLLEGFTNELMMLRNQNNELSRRLSEQIMKTEEFKNLSVHLKELKDKADVECLLARDKKESEVPSVAVQESLRMAFVREQCETKLQELRNQVYISKKHGEEMLLKLQDALDEVENRKRSEASHRKKNEELSLKILDLESELQMVLAEKRERVKTCDEMKAELECLLIRFDCCKEEKQKLEDSLQDCIEEKAKVEIELNVLKERLEGLRSSTKMQGEEDLKLESVGNSIAKEAPSEELDGCLVTIQGNSTSRSVVEIPSQTVINQEELRQLALINEHFKVQSLKTSMGHLHEELEKMKNEDWASLPQDASFDPAFNGLQREVLRLNKVNEQLGSIFPSFNEFSWSGNALERVLALEIELAQSLQAKKKSNMHFQSSFLKQHSDEEAVFQSFRDINELIKDMLEVKGRYSVVETELKEMHDRYSQLSLRFAEVEGERQKLVMTLKNARTPKKTSNLYCSTSATFVDNS
ncbi:hypothetical protein Scep_001877 [Stephania cephalantha]|uniref:C2 NT-type domain-containing protein n=1 Tax=Stephania cephalantha TaxID=152367 RepID=A0AAP0L924_9MAGN